MSQSPTRAARRASERAALRSTRDIPPDTRARIAAAKAPDESKAAPGASSAHEGNAPGTGERGDAAAADTPPLDPEQLPPELRAALDQMDGPERDEALRRAGAMVAAAGITDGGDEGGAPARQRAPRGRAGKAGKARTLESELAILLMCPTPLFEAAGDEYCAAHFSTQGPALAAALTAYAETHPGTFALLERIVATGGFAVVALALVGYTLPPMMHHGIIPAPVGLRRYYRVPEPPHHAPQAAEPEATEPAQAA
jgi:hypothetical protein